MAAETTSNYFSLLGLDPNSPWDEERFRRVLQDKRTQWSRESTSIGRKAIVAKANLEHIPDIERVMSDPTQRKLHAQQLKHNDEGRQQEKRSDFQRQLAVAERKGFLDEAELTAFISDFQDVLPASTIRAAVKVPLRGSEQRSIEEQAELDPTTFTDILQKLAFVHEESLYTLLGMPLTTGHQELEHAAEQLYDEMQAHQQKTPAVTAKASLASHAKAIFTSAAMRQKYDGSMKQRALDLLFQDLTPSVNRTEKKEVYSEQIDAFIETACKAGWTQDDAERTLQNHARKLGWLLRTEATQVSKIRCGFCQQLNPPERDFCIQCNRSLTLTCPNCGRTARSDEKGCGSCGFPVGNSYLVDSLLDTVQSCITDGNFIHAQASLQEAKRAWQPTPETTTWTPKQPDSRLRKIHTYDTDLTLRLAQQQQKTQRMQQFINGRFFYAARDFLAADSSEELRAFSSSISSAIEQAQQAFALAQSTNDINAKRSYCQQALHFCADCQPARDLLHTIPPPPPTGLVAHVNSASNSVVLAWQPINLPGTQYVVIRKTYSSPISIEDGVRVGTTDQCSYDDRAAESNISLHYAVFSVFENVPSLQPASTPDVVFLAQDVTHEVAHIDTNCVTLQWEAPAVAHTLRVVRKENNPPQSVDDGIELPLQSPTSLVDSNVANNHTYFYGIYCTYISHDMRSFVSPGKILEVVPEPPPAVVTHLHIDHTSITGGYEVHIQWQLPERGESVYILQSPHDPSIPVGTPLPFDQWQPSGQWLPQKQDDSTLEILPEPGVFFYTPFVLFHGYIYTGVTHRYTCTEEVQQFKWHNSASTLRLTWLWPNLCNEVQIQYKPTDMQPSNESTGAPRIVKVTRVEYEARGHYDIQNLAPQNYDLVISTLIRRRADVILSPGVTVSIALLTKIAITYEIKNPRIGQKQRTLHLYAQGVGLLPTLLLISKRNGIPLAKTDGTLLHKEIGPLDIAFELKIALPDTKFAPNTFGRLFLEDDSLYSVIVIQHPHNGKLRLS